MPKMITAEHFEAGLTTALHQPFRVVPFSIQVRGVDIGWRKSAIFRAIRQTTPGVLTAFLKKTASFLRFGERTVEIPAP